LGEQILVNLISNAMNAMSRQPEGQRRLHVRLEAAGNTARIQVVDNGKGIALEFPLTSGRSIPSIV
jgi:C4-dicarboxylate-specific signal transduction histidine kinase